MLELASDYESQIRASSPIWRIVYDDVASFSVKLEPPIKVSYRDYEIWGCGPWSQGPTLPIALNILVYLFQLMLTERGQDAFILGFGLVPAYFSVVNVFTAMFVHGGFAHLAGNSLGLDLYTLFAYRLPRLREGLHLSWPQLRDQLGSGEAHTRSLAQRIRDVLPEIAAVYPEAKVEATRHGLMLRPSLPAVPRTAVQVRGLGLVAGKR